MAATPSRPARTFTKHNTVFGLAYCGIIVLVCLLGPVDVELAKTTVAAAFAMATALLGIYQAVGHLDLRAQKGAGE